MLKSGVVPASQAEWMLLQHSQQDVVRIRLISRNEEMDMPPKRPSCHLESQMLHRSADGVGTSNRGWFTRKDRVSSSKRARDKKPPSLDCLMGI